MLQGGGQVVAFAPIQRVLMTRYHSPAVLIALKTKHQALTQKQRKKVPAMHRRGTQPEPHSAHAVNHYHRLPARSPRQTTPEAPLVYPTTSE